MIPGFRISHEAIDHDVELVRAMGAELVNGKEITSVDELKKEYDYVVLAVGASEPGRLKTGSRRNHERIRVFGTV